MNSMTGYGRAELHRKEYGLSVDLASINSRYLESICRMPRALAGLESNIKKEISSNFSRGKITITVNIEISPSSAQIIDMDAAEAFYKQLRSIKKKLKLKGELDISQIASAREVLVNPQETFEANGLWPDIDKLLNKAIRDLKKMRAAEGKNLARDMRKRCRQIGLFIKELEKQASRNVAEYKKRLEKRINDLGDGIQLDSSRLAEEVTIYADRSDISEECTRLKSHLIMFVNTLKNSDPSGKRMTFILQEMGREANTIGSKSLSGKTAAVAIEIKEEIEKLREQAQNIE
ncbi:MAG: YicC/YloC family endoribonuclease [candidate division Zixibacteria bacterium]